METVYTIAVHMRLNRCNGFNAGSPCPEISLCILKDLACLEFMVVSLARITRDHRLIIDIVEQTASVASKKNLLLSTLDNSRGVDVKGLLELCTGLRSCMSK